ncbi:Aph phosphorylate [Mycena venus]|uniref:Aph phosphorylate n=1 Tax=Mycena venus TaxID=2733690 RepID=A0A8H7CX22_9AGAR|nr:Aph phosphorylate [Mycena venus]
MASDPTKMDALDSEQRKLNVQRILQDSLGLTVNSTDIAPIDRGYNNYLYTVKIANALTKPGNTQPGTVALSTGHTQDLVVRLLKTELGAIPERVQNEVAALFLARQPLASVVRVPEVYAWSEGRGPHGIPFIIMELLPGVPLDTIWPHLDLPTRLPILTQIGQILTVLRSIQIPVPLAPSNYAFGGLTFSASGNITTTVHPDANGGPFTCAEEQWLFMLSNKLQDADKNTFIKGWKGAAQPDLRNRIDSFIEKDNGFRVILRQVAQEPIFVHGDYKCQNFLISPETHRITGLLDFEFARIGTAPEELLDGLGDFRQHTCVQPAPDGFNIHLLESNGWPCQLSGPTSLGCQTAKAWRDLIQHPTQYEETAKMSAFIEELCPWYFCQEPWCNSHDMVVERRIAERSLSNLLKTWGF